MSLEHAPHIPARLDLIARTLEASGYAYEAGTVQTVRNYVAALERAVVAARNDAENWKHRCEDAEGRLGAALGRRSHRDEAGD